MPYRVTCPHCACALKVMDDVEPPSVTCPRCLGIIPNPGAARLAAVAPGLSPFPKALLAEDDARRDSTKIGCFLALLPFLVATGIFPITIVVIKSRFQRDLMIWLLTGVLGIVTLGSLGTLFWRGARISPAFVKVLSGIGVLAIMTILLILFESNATAEDFAAFAISVLIVLAFLGLVSTGIMLWRTQDVPQARSLGRVFLGTFALVGALILGGVAFFILFFLVCLGVFVTEGGF